MNYVIDLFIMFSNYIQFCRQLLSCPFHRWENQFRSAKISCLGPVTRPSGRILIIFCLIQLQSVCSVHTRLLDSVFLSNKNLLFFFTLINSSGDDGKEFYLTCKGCFEKPRLLFNMRNAILLMLQIDQSYAKATKARKRQRLTLYPSTMNPGQFF